MRSILVLAALALAACGGSTTDVTGSHDDGGPLGDQETDASLSTPDVVVHHDAPVQSEDAGTGGTSESTGDAGTLLLQAFGGPAGQVVAQVPLLEPGVGQQQACATPVHAGACTLTACTLGGVGDPAPGEGNFGLIYASVGPTTETITYDEAGYGTVDFPAAVSLGTGGTMSFHGGNGGTVPAFEVAATIPGLAVITSPVPTTDGGTATIDTSHDLSVTWLPISVGKIHFEVSGGGFEPGSTATSIACTFGGAAGSGVISSTLLDSLKMNTGSSRSYATISSELDATKVVRGLTIVTQSFQVSGANVSNFEVRLQ